ncbi:MAG: fibronectin type III domain-containing protein [Clostridiaceae bacterium]|nr:fibronectin type III domain-containing protein [Clostridiaceae bacterium]
MALMLLCTNMQASALTIPPVRTLPIFFDTSKIQTTPLYRLFNGTFHTYTASSSERSALLNNGWTDEGISCWISPQPLPYTVPLYRLKLYGMDTFMTTSKTEHDGAIANYGYVDEGIMGYVIPADDYAHGDVTLYRWYRPQSTADSSWFDDLFGSGDPFVAFDAEHFYQTELAMISGYTYEGAQCRAWSSSTTVQDVSLSSPNGGESYTIGDTVNIQWSTTLSGGTINLYYTTGGADGSWVSIVQNLSDTGSYSWKVPSTPSSTVRVRVQWRYHDNLTSTDASVADDSNADFAITGTPVIIPIIRFHIFAPDAPSGLTTAADYIHRTIQLSWNDNSNNETGFTIERKTDDGAYSQIATTAANVTDYTDTTVSIDTMYTYRVYANGIKLNSGYSGEAVGQIFSFTVEPPVDLGKMIPGAPTNLTVSGTAGYTDRAVLNWNAASGFVTGYRIERKAGESGTWSTLTVVGNSNTAYTDFGLTAGVSYSYRVRAYSLILESEPSNEATYIPPSINGSGGIELGRYDAWASEELDAANDAGLIPDILANTDLTKPITREEFCELAVRLYEKMTGNHAFPASPNPFTDTANEQILKAYSLGITNGTSATTFSPSELINREQCATMIFRAIKLIDPNADYSVAAVADFPDQANISSWAVAATKYMAKIGIIKGDSSGNFMPKPVTAAQSESGYGMAKREEAILMVERTYVKIS